MVLVWEGAGAGHSLAAASLFSFVMCQMLEAFPLSKRQFSLWNKPHDVVLVWEGAGVGRSLGAASLFSFVMVA